MAEGLQKAAKEIGDAAVPIGEDATKEVSATAKRVAKEAPKRADELSKQAEDQAEEIARQAKPTADKAAKQVHVSSHSPGLVRRRRMLAMRRVPNRPSSPFPNDCQCCTAVRAVIARVLRSRLICLTEGLLCCQDAATTAEKEAEPTAAKVVDTAGDTAHDVTKATHQKWEEVKPEEKVDQAAEQTTKTVKVSCCCLSTMQPCSSLPG